MKLRSLVHWILPVSLLLALYFVSRLLAIRTLPPFNDEFIYVRWAQQGFFEPGKRLLSLTDGKQPLFIWLVSLMMNLTPSPLAAGRIVSILAGAASLIGVGVLSYQLFKNRVVSLVSSLFYIVSPFSLLLDRFALYDSLLAALFVWSMVLMNLLLRIPTLGTAWILAALLGAALLTKSSAMLFLLILPLSFFLLPGRNKSKAFGLFLLACAVAFVYQSVQLVSPDIAFVKEKNLVFLYEFKEIRAGFAGIVGRNLPAFAGWISQYLSWPVIAAGLAAFFLDRKNRRAHVFLLAAFCIPFAAAVITGKTVYPRHLFFAAIPFFILAAAFLQLAWRRFPRWLTVVLYGLCLVPSIVFSGKILADFSTVPLPEIDRFQYIDGWPAGWGVKEIVRYVDAESQKGPLTVLTEGTYGSLPTTIMQLYFRNYPQVHIAPVDDATFEIPLSVDRGQPLYAILNRAQEVPPTWVAEEVLRIRKGNGNSFIRLMRVVGGR